MDDDTKARKPIHAYALQANYKSLGAQWNFPVCNELRYGRYKALVVSHATHLEKIYDALSDFSVQLLGNAGTNVLEKLVLLGI